MARSVTRHLVTAAAGAAMVVTVAAADIKVKTEYDKRRTIEEAARKLLAKFPPRQ
jgi:hypothetical protein